MADGTPGADRAQAPDRLTAEERASRQRRSQRLAYALRHPTHVTNPDAMRDALIDALGDRPTIGTLRRGPNTCTPESASVPEPFAWDAVRRRADEEHAKAIADLLNPRRSQRTGHFQSREWKCASPGKRDTNRDRAYALAALRNEADEVAAAPVGLRNETLNRAAWKLARLDALDHTEIADVLVAAAHDCGLGALEARATIRGALKRRIS
jgi:hypothetical protein